MHSSSNSKIEGYNEKLTYSTINHDTKGLSLLARLANSFILSGATYLYYNKYSSIVYEGDNLNVFGAMTYNSNSDSWELSNPLAYIKEGFLSDYKFDLLLNQLTTGMGFGLRFALAALCGLGLIWAGKRLFRRLQNRIM